MPMAGPVKFKPTLFLVFILIYTVISDVQSVVERIKNDARPTGAAESFHLNPLNLLKILDSFEIKVMVDVILVGFDGKYEMDTFQLQTHFDKFTEAFEKEQELVHFESQNKPSAVGHTLVRRKIIYRVTKAVPSLAEKINGKILSIQGKTEGDQQVVIPSEEIDDLIRKDFTKLGVSYSLYFIQTGTDTDYRYSHGGGGGGGGCPAAGRAGAHGRRYAWVDLEAAGAAGHGPLVRGEGGVPPGSLPWPRGLAHRATRAAAQGAAAAAAAGGEGGAGGALGPLYPGLVALAHRSVRHLVAPALVKPPVVAPNVEIDLFHICISKSAVVCPGLQDDFEDFAVTLQGRLEEMELIGQEAVVQTHYAHVADNSLLASGFSSALETIDDALMLDSDELHYWLKRVYDAYGTDEPEDGSTVRFPIFVSEIDSDYPVLLDGKEMARVFEDLAIVVYSQAGAAPSGLGCGAAGGEEEGAAAAAPHVYAAHAPARALAGALWGVWGVPSRRGTFDPLGHRRGEDHLWAAGDGLDTPLAVFDGHYAFPELDAPRQNLILQKFDSSLDRLRTFLEQAAEVAPRAAAAASPREAAALSAAWRAVHQGLLQASTYFSLHNFNYAWQLIDNCQESIQEFELMYTNYLDVYWKFQIDADELVGASLLGRGNNQSSLSAGSSSMGTMIMVCGLLLWVVNISISLYTSLWKPKNMHNKQFA